MAVGSGKSFPLGASIQQGGVNFSVFSEHATAVQLLLFDRADDGRPARTIDLDPRRQRTYHYWHAFVPGLRAGQIYAWRVEGPRRPDLGLRFDPDKVLLDPYGRAVAMPAAYDRGAASRPGDNAAVAAKSVVVDCAGYDWEGDQPLYRPFSSSVIYEMHVRGFTRHPSSGVDRGPARHLCRSDREDPVPRRPRHHRGRAPARVPVRPAGRAGRADQLLGLCADLVLRAARRLQRRIGSLRRARRVPRHGQGAAPGEHRGHPRRRLQPHRRGRRARTDLVLSRPGQRGLLHPRSRTGRATPTTPAPATR